MMSDPSNSLKLSLSIGTMRMYFCARATYSVRDTRLVYNSQVDYEMCQVRTLVSALTF